MFSLGFFFPRRKPLTLYEGIVLWLCMGCVFLEREIVREAVRENKGYYNRSDVGCVSSFRWIIERKDWLFVVDVAQTG